MKLGLAGHLTRAFIASPLTPLFLLAAFALGLVALVTLPREEEPQISVPMVDIHVEANGLKAEDAVKLVTEPLETIVKSIDGVEHVYSQTEDDGTVVTARFLVGTNADAAILRKAMDDARPLFIRMHVSREEFAPRLRMALMARPFDPAGLKALFDSVHANDAALRSEIEARVVDTLSRLSPEGRLRLAESRLP